MIFLVNTSITLALLAFAGGVALILWAGREATCKVLAKVAGVFVMLVSVLAMSCTLYHAWIYRAAGHFEIKAAGSGLPGMGQGGGMMKCPMMEKMKEKMGAESAPMGEGASGHDAHH